MIFFTLKGSSVAAFFFLLLCTTTSEELCFRIAGITILAVIVEIIFVG
jgi:hypothetical protein